MPGLAARGKRPRAGEVSPLGQISAVAWDRGKRHLPDRKEAVMAQLGRRHPRLPDLFDIFDEPWAPLLLFTAGLPVPGGGLHPGGQLRSPRRAARPGPEKDVGVSVEGGR